MHAHVHDDRQPHGHSHGLVDDSIKRSREGMRAVSWRTVRGAHRHDHAAA